MERQSHKAIDRILKIGSMTHDEAIKFIQSEKKPALRWKPMDVAFGDNIYKPRRLVIEVKPEYPSFCYTTCSESDGVGNHSDYSLMTKEEWLAWVERFSDDLTGKELREAKEAVMADFKEPQSWTDFRRRYAETGDPWIREANTSNEWVDAAKSLPDDETTVLISLSDGEVWTGYHVGNEWRFVCDSPVDQGEGTKVLWWAHFPAPKSADRTQRRSWIRFIEATPKPRTRVWIVYPNQGGSAIPLGGVSWYGPWRKYAFFPMDQTVFEEDCLREIAQFCADQTRSHKQTKSRPQPGKQT